MRIPRPVLILAGSALPALGAGAASSQELEQLRSLEIEDLAAIEITSASRRAESLVDAATSVYVISRDDIRRSGATSLPEMLRLAPNLQVARVDASSYAISARGFNSTTANKMLVLIDGRSIYTPLYSGVFWDAQEVMAEDIERIEVISGPGGTLWGSNAVNGVINVITRSARDTQGTVVNAAVGSDEQTASARYGGRIGDATRFRTYAQHAGRDHTETAAGSNASDDWELSQGGFRLDWSGNQDTLSLHGDLYDGSIEQPLPGERSISGRNVVLRWNRASVDGSTLEVQAYYDHTHRDHPGVFEESRTTYDVSAQYDTIIAEHHRVVVGGGYRTSEDHVDNTFRINFLPDSRSRDLANAFVSDQIFINPELTLSLGVKLEHNDYTGFETMPDLRVAWKPVAGTLLWSAVSRAVRTPSRIDRDLYVPAVLAGGPDFESEELTAYEIGVRTNPIERATVSVSAFYNVYDELRSLEPATASSIFPLVIANRLEGDTRGIEVWGNLSISDWWRVDAGFTRLWKDLDFEQGSIALYNADATGNDPGYQFSIRSSMNLPHSLELNLALRSIDALDATNVDRYTAFDANLGWQASPKLRFSLSARNLFDDHHAEFSTGGSGGNELPRTLLVGVHLAL